ncbi:MAG: hypothetical protein RIM84_07390 [Alphaproteobacteria bacterium]
MGQYVAELAADIVPGLTSSNPGTLSNDGALIPVGDALVFTIEHFDYTWEGLEEYFDPSLIRFDGATATEVEGLSDYDLDYPTAWVVYQDQLVFAGYAESLGQTVFTYDGNNLGVPASDVPLLRPSDFVELDGAVYFNAEVDGVDVIAKLQGGVAEIVVEHQGLAYSKLKLGDDLYFFDRTADNSHELFRFDGDDVVQLTDIDEPSGRALSDLLELNGSLFFVGEVGYHGPQGLWRYDDGGATLLQTFDDHAGGLTRFGDEIVFYADDGVHGRELWATDGETARLLADINPDGASYPQRFFEFGGELLFNAEARANDTELYAYDGETVRQVAEINPGPDASVPQDHVLFEDMVVFAAYENSVGNELWYYDGTTVGVLADILPGGGFENSSSPRHLTVFQDQLYFAAWTPDNGNELWRLYYDDSVVVEPADTSVPEESAEPAIEDEGPMIGGDGRDDFAGGDGDDWAWGLGGDDSLDGGAGGDNLYGNRGNDWIGGGDGDDVGRGHVGDDALEGGAGADELYGGGDDDGLLGGDGDDALNGNSGADSVGGGDGDDVVRGQGGPDLLTGGVGNDTLVGHQGFDTLLGGDGDDVLIGGMADDSLTGGAGADVFSFGAGGGTDTVADFERGVDRLVFDGLADFAALDISAVGGGTQVSFAGTTVIVLGVDNLVAADFGL